MPLEWNGNYITRWTEDWREYNRVEVFLRQRLRKVATKNRSGIWLGNNSRHPTPTHAQHCCKLLLLLFLFARKLSLQWLLFAIAAGTQLESLPRQVRGLCPPVSARKGFEHREPVPGDICASNLSRMLRQQPRRQRRSLHIWQTSRLADEPPNAR